MIKKKDSRVADFEVGRVGDGNKCEFRWGTGERVGPKKGREEEEGRGRGLCICLQLENSLGWVVSYSSKI